MTHFLYFVLWEMFFDRSITTTIPPDRSKSDTIWDTMSHPYLTIYRYFTRLFHITRKFSRYIEKLKLTNLLLYVAASPYTPKLPKSSSFLDRLDGTIISRRRPGSSSLLISFLFSFLLANIKWLVNIEYCKSEAEDILPRLRDAGISRASKN